MVFSCLDEIQHFGLDIFKWMLLDSKAFDHVGLDWIHEIKKKRPDCRLIVTSLKFDLKLGSLFIMKGVDDFLIKAYAKGEHFELLLSKFLIA